LAVAVAVAVAVVMVMVVHAENCFGYFTLFTLCVFL
jgi:hypothetical protein